MVDPSELSLMQALPIDGILESLRIGVGFLWTAAWAIIMGLVITSLVKCTSPKSGWQAFSGGTSPASRERRRSARRAAAVASVL